MTDTRKDGGPAFPHDPDMSLTDQFGNDINVGMSMRDWFAGQALAGIASNSSENFSLSPQDEAAWAYDRADAMLAERSK